MAKGIPAKRQGASAFLLAEEAVQLLLHSGWASLSVYIIGSVPFVAALIVYVGTMAHSGYAHAYLGTGALGLALLFGLMKAVQARFAQHLRATLQDQELVPWTIGGFFSTYCRQICIHATVVIVYPVSFVTLLPMAFAAAFYQNVAVLDDGADPSLRNLARRSLAQARLWPKQNHLLLWLCSPLMVCLGAGVILVTYPMLRGVEDDFLVSLGGIYASIMLLAIFPMAPFSAFTAANVGTGLFFAIEVFHILTGADTLYARNPGALLQNDLFVAVACGTTYLLLDPILKAAYTIRCHEGESLETGVDLRVVLRRIRQAAVCLLLLGTVATALPVEAQPPATETHVSPLDESIDQELDERRYTWRMPRDVQPEVELPWLLQMIVDFGESIRGWLATAFEFIVDVIRDIWDWFFGNDETGVTTASGGGGGFQKSIRLLVGLLAALIAGITAYFLWRAYRERSTTVLTPLAAVADSTPDLEDENTTAADLPEDEWQQLAVELARKGDFRLASRALFFSILAILAQREVIRIARFKSNMDYDHELARRKSSIGAVPQLFARSALLYESVWYGEHTASEQTLQQLQGFHDEVRHGL